MCQCLQDKGELVMRAYTPTSTEADKGHFDLVVKVYWANEHPSFPDVSPSPGRAAALLRPCSLLETCRCQACSKCMGWHLLDSRWGILQGLPAGSLDSACAVLMMAGQC